MATRDLFDDDDHQDNEEGGASLKAANTELNVNEEYARRFEHNKKRADLHRLEEKYKSKTTNDADDSASDGSSSDSETEDEEGFLATEALDAEISATLNAIKNKDPRIYEKEAAFYKPIDGENMLPAQEKKAKPVYLRDYHRDKYLAGDTGAEEEEAPEMPQTFAQEQAALKDDLLAEINATLGTDGAESDDDDFMKATSKPTPASTSVSQNGVHSSRAKAVSKAELDPSKADKDPERFLSNYMTSRAWTEADGSKWEAFESDEGEGNDDADEFETAFNLRFENPAKSNAVLKSYSRKITEARSVRKDQATGRTRQRELEKEKKEAERAQRHEEKARLKKLKLEEAEQQLAKIKKAAGMRGKTLVEQELLELLENAWENDKWEEEMNRRFGEQYYAEADEDLEEADNDEAGAKKSRKDPKKPKWDDDIDILDLVPDFDDEQDHSKITLSDDEDEAQLDADEQAAGSEDDLDDEQPSSKKRKTTADHKKDRIAAKQASKKQRANVETLIDSRMELDNPLVLAKKTKRDFVAAERVVPFRYRETSPTSFGLTARDILLAPSDAALNEFAGIKKLASFRDQQRKAKDKKKLGKKARLREWRRENFGREYEHSGPTFGLEGAEGDTGADAVQDARKDWRKDAPEGEAQSNIIEGKKKRKRSKGK